ncbi:hypothetical protein BG004_008237 [Podila humilis]|nr:hypothetical protein BG004_008237 [Podila humilis]
MAARFFRSLPNAHWIQDPYEEVFMLFTTETADAPWSHNRSVSQTSTRLEVELDFTPAPSPTVSQPGSRPESRTGLGLMNSSGSSGVDYFGGNGSSSTSSYALVSASAAAADSITTTPPLTPEMDGYSSAIVVSGSSRSSPPLPLLKAPRPTIAGFIESGPELVRSESTGLMDPNPGAIELYNKNNDNDNNNNNNDSQLQRPGSHTSPPTTPTLASRNSRSLATRAIMGNRKSSRKLLKDSSSSSSPVQTSSSPSLSSPSTKKPVVIHQSLSTLSQPGQTGTVVWDSSILMAKFLLSIKDLHTRCYLDANATSKTMRKRRSGSGVGESKRKMSIQEQQIRQLEQQAEHMHVAASGEFVMESERGREGTNNGFIARTSETRDDEEEEEEDMSDDSSEDDEDQDSDSDQQQQQQQQGRQPNLVFDPARTTILELGSGCGLLGIVLADFCKELLLTDQAPVLPLLVKNLRKNLDKKYFEKQGRGGGETSSTASSTTSKTFKRSNNHSTSSSDNSQANNNYKPNCHIQVQELVWGQALDQDLERGQGVDFVIATDVVYNESVVPKLVQTLKDLCAIRQRFRGKSYSTSASSSSSSSSSSRNIPQRTVVLLGQELRTDYVHLAFLEKLVEVGFRMVRIPKSMMDSDFQSGYVVYAFYLKEHIDG